MAYLKVITGPMFSGKTEELIRALKRAEIQGRKVLVFKPAVDTRTGTAIVARQKSDLGKKEFTASLSMPATPIRSAAELRAHIHQYHPEVIGFDEAHFFDSWFSDFIIQLLQENKDQDFRIYISGLDTDFKARPFRVIPELLAIADEVDKVTAVCFKCGKPAPLSQRLILSTKQIEVGDFDLYEARCRECYTLPED